MSLPRRTARSALQEQSVSRTISQEGGPNRSVLLTIDGERSTARSERR
jgi:hypothetical protein